MMDERLIATKSIVDALGATAERLLNRGMVFDWGIVKAALELLAAAVEAQVAAPAVAAPPPAEKPPKAAKPADAGGHRHTYGDDGVCHVKVRGKGECGSVRERSRGDRKVPVAGNPDIPPKVDQPSMTLPLSPPALERAQLPSVTRHARAVSGSGAFAAGCGATVDGMNITTPVEGQVNCPACKAWLVQVSGSAL